MGTFRGESPWEIHPGDEFLHVVEGSVILILMLEDGPSEVHLTAGCHWVVPKNTWHRQIAEDEVVQIGASPGPTRHSDAEDPRAR